jgi:2-polyprenyl-6-methoxyphenol hydroxylase-like FAD-dependent oxidoreductase
MAGIVLKRLGHDVRILETDPSSIRSSQAAGIHAGAAVQEFFEKHDLTGGPWAIACSGLQFIDKQNKVVRLLNLPMQMTAWSTLYYRLRANFDGFESLYVPKAPERGADDGETMYDYGKRVIDVSLVGDHVKVQYEDVLDGDELKKPKAISADLVIAADGSRSRIREKLCDVKRPYAGYVAWRGCVVESEVSEETRNIIGDRVTIFNMKRNYILVSVHLFLSPYPSGFLAVSLRY